MIKILQFDGELLHKTIREIVQSVELRGIQWSRFSELNRLLKGFRSHEMSVLSGRTGVGKTTFTCEYSLDLAEQGITTLWGSFELPLHRICNTLLKQYAGETIDQTRPDRVAAWASMFKNEVPIYFLDVHGRPPELEVFSTLEASIQKLNIEHVVLDNLQFMIGSAGRRFEDKFERQDRFIERLRKFASLSGCHVTIIVHPRKTEETNLLTVNSLYGSGKISQEADNILLIQEEVSTAIPKKYMQVVKNRYDGTLGKFDLHFNRDRLAFKPISRALNIEAPASKFSV